MQQIHSFLISITLIILISACSSDSVTNPQEVEPPQAAFSSIQTEVLDNSCALSGCHDGTRRPNLTAGVAFVNIVNMPSTQGLNYIEPGDPDNSYLYLKLLGNNISGSRMPVGADPLSIAVTDSIKKWIENGALNN